MLSCSQHLTLLISGFRGLYPVLENDVSYTSSAQRLGVSLGFKVGLSQKYKPGAEQAQEIVRKHSLIIQDAEDEVRIQAERVAQQQQQQRLDWFDDLNEDEPMPAEVAPEVAPEEEEVVDEGRFDGFSLSSSLESLMDQSFLKIVQLRRKFDLGWAGAEFLHSEIERSQQVDKEVLRMKHNVSINSAELPRDELIFLCRPRKSSKLIVMKGNLKRQTFHMTHSSDLKPRSLLICL